MKTELRLLKQDHVKPCPFCGELKELDIHTDGVPCYTLECLCGGQMVGEYHPPRKNYGDHDEIAHHKAKASVIEAWNKRVGKK